MTIQSDPVVIPSVILSFLPKGVLHFCSSLLNKNEKVRQSYLRFFEL